MHGRWTSAHGPAPAQVRTENVGTSFLPWGGHRCWTEAGFVCGGGCIFPSMLFLSPPRPKPAQGKKLPGATLSDSMTDWPARALSLPRQEPLPLKGSDCCPFPGQLSHSLCPWLSEWIHLQSFLGNSAPTPSSPEGKSLLIQEGFLELAFLKKWENLTNLISVGTLLNLWKISHTDKETNKQINVHSQPGVTNHDIEEKEGLGCQQGRCCSCWLSGLRKVT